MKNFHYENEIGNCARTWLIFLDALEVHGPSDVNWYCSCQAENLSWSEKNSENWINFSRGNLVDDEKCLTREKWCANKWQEIKLNQTKRANILTSSWYMSPRNKKCLKRFTSNTFSIIKFSLAIQTRPPPAQHFSLLKFRQKLVEISTEIIAWQWLCSRIKFPL